MVLNTLPDSGLLRSEDWRAAVRFIADMFDALDDEGDTFARCGVEQATRLVASDLTTLSLCDLCSGRRYVIASPLTTLDAEARASFDRHFREHPLVRYHGQQHGPYTHRISDSVPFQRFQRTTLYDEYYRSIGIDHVMAMPIMVSDRWLVSFVLNRSGRDFSDRERALLDQVRECIGRLFQRTRLLQRVSAAGLTVSARPSLPRLPTLSQREHEVLAWVAAGKTDRDIATILHISHRTVHKHLQRVYDKLGVETRIAAVMRALAMH